MQRFFVVALLHRVIAAPTVAPTTTPTTAGPTTAEPTTTPTPAPSIYAAISLSAARVYAEEGESVKYRIWLESEPSSYVLITASISSSLASVTTSMPLNFTGTTPQVVEVAATQNDDDSGEYYNDVQVIHTASSADAKYDTAAIYNPSGTLVVRVYDDDSCVRDCSAGSYLSICNSTQTCLPSPAGYYALGGCSTPIPCPAGTFRAQTGGNSSASCSNCSASTYASNPGSTTCTACPAGYGCVNRVSPQPCAAGRVARLGDGVCSSCAAGRYNTRAAQETCWPCPAGYACQVPANPPEPCSPASYSLGSAANCTACPAGNMCSSTTSEPQACVRGSYALYNWGFCVVCPEGFACASTSSEPVQCVAGTASLAGSTACVTCEIGRYANASGLARCAECPRGYSCEDVAASPSPCLNGTFSDLAESTCSACPVGTTSRAEANECTICPAGYEVRASQRAFVTSLAVSSRRRQPSTVLDWMVQRVRL